MKKLFTLLALVTCLSVLFTSCSTYSKSMTEPTNHIQFTHNDYTFSDQVSGEASQTKLFGIDFARLVSEKYGQTSRIGYSSVPIIGSFISNNVVNYALYNIMLDNPGYDIVLYPQYDIQTTSFLIGKLHV
ncbi:MAG: hypothetical protein ACKOW8_10955 [Flavobacteriales bacterium]